MSKAKGLLWVAAVGVAAAAAVPGLPWAARHVPWAMERALAALIGGAPEASACQGRARPESQQAFDDLVKRVYPLDAGDAALPITITVIPGKAVNAFATLGGHIYVFEGLIRQAQSPEELAGVLAHEIEHVRNRHIIQGMAVNLFTLAAITGAAHGDPSAGSRLAYLLLTMKFSRQQEEEADLQGLQRLQRAQIDAAGFQAFFDRAQKLPEAPPILSNHPSSEYRAQLAAQFRGYPVRAVLDQRRWQDLGTICQ